MQGLSSQPQTVRQILGQSFAVYISVIKKLALVATIFSLLLTTVNYYSTPFFNTHSETFKGGMLLYIFILLVISSLFTSVMVYLAGKTIAQEPITLVDAITRSIHKILTIVGTQILYIFIFLVIGAISILIAKFSLALLGILVFLILSVILLIRLYFIIPLIMFNNTNIIQSLTHSYQLTIGYWWRTLFLIIIGSLPYIPFIIINHFLPKMGANIVDIIQTIVVLPFSISILFLQFHDLTLRQGNNEE